MFKEGCAREQRKGAVKAIRAARRGTSKSCVNKMGVRAKKVGTTRTKKDTQINNPNGWRRVFGFKDPFLEGAKKSKGISGETMHGQ